MDSLKNVLDGPNGPGMLQLLNAYPPVSSGTGPGPWILCHSCGTGPQSPGMDTEATKVAKLRADPVKQ